MAKAGTKKTAANGSKKYHKKRKSNPTRTMRKRRHNPGGIAAMIGSPKDVMTGAIAGLVAAVATRQIPQVVLGASNNGIEGYGANFVTALVATWGAGAFAGAAAGRGALIGGMVILLDRILSEQVSPISSYLALSGVGDHNAYSKLGTVRNGSYTHPGLLNPDGSTYVPDAYTQAAVDAVMRNPALAAMVNGGNAPAGRVGAVNPSALRRHTASGMLLSSRFQGRFNQ